MPSNTTQEKEMAAACKASLEQKGMIPFNPFENALLESQYYPDGRKPSTTRKYLKQTSSTEEQDLVRAISLSVSAEELELEEVLSLSVRSMEEAQLASQPSEKKQFHKLAAVAPGKNYNEEDEILRVMKESQLSSQLSDKEIGRAVETFAAPADRNEMDLDDLMRQQNVRSSLYLMKEQLKHDIRTFEHNSACEQPPNLKTILRRGSGKLKFDRSSIDYTDYHKIDNDKILPVSTFSISKRPEIASSLARTKAALNPDVEKIAIAEAMLCEPQPKLESILERDSGKFKFDRCPIGYTDYHKNDNDKTLPISSFPISDRLEIALSLTRIKAAQNPNAQKIAIAEAMATTSKIFRIDSCSLDGKKWTDADIEYVKETLQKIVSVNQANTRQMSQIKNNISIKEVLESSEVVKRTSIRRGSTQEALELVLQMEKCEASKGHESTFLSRKDTNDALRAVRDMELDRERIPLSRKDTADSLRAVKEMEFAEASKAKIYGLRQKSLRK